jgi:hypothetical protein
MRMSSPFDSHEATPAGLPLPAVTYRGPVTTPELQTIVLASPPIDGTREEQEAWAKALIDSMRPETA